MIWLAAWLAAVGVWPLAEPEHMDWSDPWWMLDLILHTIGTTIVVLWWRTRHARQ